MWNFVKIDKVLALCAIALSMQSGDSHSLQAVLVWSTPANISSPGVNGLNPQATFVSIRNATVVWSGYDGMHYTIQTATAQIGAKWSPPYRLSDTGKNAFFASAAADDKGNTIGVWSLFNNDHFVIQSDSKAVNKQWKKPVQISTSSSHLGDATKPQLAFDQMGNAITVWQQYDGLNNAIFSAYKKEENVWSKPLRLSVSQPFGMGAIDPQVILDNSGKAIAVWLDDSSSSIQYAIKSLRGQWSTPINLSDSSYRVSAPQLAVDGSGKATVVWAKNNGTNHVIQAAVIDRYGKPSAPIDLSSQSQDATQPQIAVDSLGNCAAVWQAFNGENTIIQTVVRLANSGWSPTVDLSEIGQDASEPQIAIDSSGQLVALWKRSDKQNFIVQATTSSLGSTIWSTPVSLSLPGEDAMTPQMALDSVGNAVAVWQRSNGKNSIIQASFGIKQH